MELRDRFIELLRSTKREGIDSVIAFLCTSDFFTAPASTKYHSCHEGGLAEHSMKVYERLKAKVEGGFYGEYSEDTVIIAALLHDIRKANMYITELKNRKTYDSEKVSAASFREIKHDSNGDFIWETVPSYSVDDKAPLGHGDKSVIILQSYIKLKKEELYSIRWHMGFTEPKEMYNQVSATFKEYPLALALHEADLEATYILEENE